MNEFYRLKQFSLSLEEYYSKFVSLRRYAPLMTEEQIIARFCQGLNSPLDSRLEAMRPTSVQDALIRAKPLSREISQDRGVRRREPMHSRPQESQNRRPAPQSNFQPRPRVYAANAPVRDLSNVQCFECHEWGHYRSTCPRLQHRTATATGTNPQNERNYQRFQQDNGNRGRGRARGRAARMNGRGRGRGGRAYGARNNPTFGDEVNNRVTLYAAVDNPGAQNQYAVIQTEATHGGETFELLIDCGSTHSFLSPRCLRKLKLDQFNTRPMTVEMANGKKFCRGPQ